MTDLWDETTDTEELRVVELKTPDVTDYKDEIIFPGPAGAVSVGIEAPRPSTDNRSYKGPRVTWRLYLAEDGKQAYATQVTDENHEHIEKDWKPTAPVRLGDYVLLQGNGQLLVVDETHFGDTYSLRETGISISS